MDIEELNARLKQFRHDHCGKKLNAEIPLRFLSDMCWALGLEPRISAYARPTRVMERGDIYPSGPVPD